MPADAGASGDAVGEDDVEGEQRGVAERGSEPEGLAVELHTGEQVDAYDRERERDAVPDVRMPRAASADHGQELDRRHGRERQAVDGR